MPSRGRSAEERNPGNQTKEEERKKVLPFPEDFLCKARSMEPGYSPVLSQDKIDRRVKVTGRNVV